MEERKKWQCPECAGWWPVGKKTCPWCAWSAWATHLLRCSMDEALQRYPELMTFSYGRWLETTWA
jgi:hypothetical protein